MKIDFSNARVLVIGDLMLDRYYFGKVSRISPEAPVPVAKIFRTTETLGGAGNVANNLAHLGAEVVLTGPVGNDENGKFFSKCCQENAIKFIPVISESSTIVKTRVIGEHQQIVRIDFESELNIDSAKMAEAIATLLEKVDWAHVVVLSDYGKGFCSDDLCKRIIEECRTMGKSVIVDPKGIQWEKYKGATVVTPNVKELSDITGKNIENTDTTIEDAGVFVRREYALDNLLVTRSEHGMSLIGGEQIVHIPTEAKEVFDVSGAGDTVVATLAASLGAGYDLETATNFSNKAAGIVCSKIGTAPIEIAELQVTLDTLSNSKLFSVEKCLQKIKIEKTNGKKIVFTNGCFDILHKGHIHLFREAKKLGSVLVVAINSDESVRKIRGENYLINNEHDRAHLLSSIEEIDYLLIFNEETPITLLSELRPDVIVKGGNYSVDDIVGRELAKQAFVIPFLNGYSSEEIGKKFSIRYSSDIRGSQAAQVLN